jgi:hypothetical protein
MTLIGLTTFSGNFNLNFIPIDNQNPLVNWPENSGILQGNPTWVGSPVNRYFSYYWQDNSTPGRAPYGLQSNGLYLFTLAWHSGAPENPGVSSTIPGLINECAPVTREEGSEFNNIAVCKYDVIITDTSPDHVSDLTSVLDGDLHKCGFKINTNVVTSTSIVYRVNADTIYTIYLDIRFQGTYTDIEINLLDPLSSQYVIGCEFNGVAHTGAIPNGAYSIYIRFFTVDFPNDAWKIFVNIITINLVSLPPTCGYPTSNSVVGTYFPINFTLPADATYVEIIFTSTTGYDENGPHRVRLDSSYWGTGSHTWWVDVANFGSGAGILTYVGGGWCGCLLAGDIYHIQIIYKGTYTNLPSVTIEYVTVGSTGNDYDCQVFSSECVCQENGVSYGSGVDEVHITIHHISEIHGYLLQLKITFMFINQSDYKIILY